MRSPCSRVVLSPYNSGPDIPQTQILSAITRNVVSPVANWPNIGLYLRARTGSAKLGLINSILLVVTQVVRWPQQPVRRHEFNRDIRRFMSEEAFRAWGGFAAQKSGPPPRPIRRRDCSAEGQPNRECRPANRRPAPWLSDPPTRN